MASTSKQMLDKARSQIGYTETPVNRTKYGKWYGLDGNAWCAMFMSWCASQVGALDIIPKHAYTPTGAKWFYDRKQWGSTPKVGALVYFAWGTGGYGRWKGIQHVGIVESIRADGRVVCIEGNVSNKVMRVVRSKTYIAGYGYPKYKTAAPAPKPPATSGGEDVVTKLPTVNFKNVTANSTTWVRGNNVKTVQGLLVARGFAPANSIRDGQVDGIGGPGTKAAVVKFQKAKGLVANAVVSESTWRKLLLV
jgi:hypothetical protein